MTENLNSAVYYVPSVKMKNDFSGFGTGQLLKGQVYPVYQNTGFVQFNKNEVEIMIESSYGVTIVKVPLNQCKLFVKIVYPKFKIGDIVINKNTLTAFRIYRYNLMQGKVYYMDGYCVATGCSSIYEESRLELASKEYKEVFKSSVEYYDNLVKEKNPTLYNIVAKPKEFA